MFIYVFSKKSYRLDQFFIGLKSCIIAISKYIYFAYIYVYTLYTFAYLYNHALEDQRLNIRDKNKISVYFKIN